MRLLFTILICTMSIICQAQNPQAHLTSSSSSTPCPSQLAENEFSRTENDYRESSISNLANFYNNNFEQGSFYTGQTGEKLFDLSLVRGIWVGAYDPSGNLSISASGYATRNRSDFDSGPGIK